MKSFIVTAYFPEVKPAHAAWQTITVTAFDFTVAATRGLQKIRLLPGLTGKHIREVRLTRSRLPIYFLTLCTETLVAQ